MFAQFLNIKFREDPFSMEEMKNACKILVVKSEERDNFEDLGTQLGG
jgi:hypothetical protein